MFKAQRYDIKGKAYLASPDKYRLGDTGLRFRRVDAGKGGVGEIDFVASSETGRTHYQVSQTVLAPETLERELAPLRAIRDAYPKVLLTMDATGPGDSEGIQVVNVVDWLPDQGGLAE